AQMCARISNMTPLEASAWIEIACPSVRVSVGVTVTVIGPSAPVDDSAVPVNADAFDERATSDASTTTPAVKHSAAVTRTNESTRRPITRAWLHYAGSVWDGTAVAYTYCSSRRPASRGIQPFAEERSLYGLSTPDELCCNGARARASSRRRAIWANT